MSAIKDNDYNIVFQSFKNIGCCHMCCLRFIGEKSPESFLNLDETLKIKNIPMEERNSPQSKILKTSACTACLGLLQKPYCDAILDNVLKHLLEADYDCDTFNIALTLPVSLQLRAHSMFLHIESVFPSFSNLHFPLGVVTIGVKDVWKWLYTPVISEVLNKKYYSNSDLTITVSLKYIDEEKECASLFSMCPDKFSKTRNRKNQGNQNSFSRKSAEGYLKMIDSETFTKDYPVPPNIPTSEVIYCETTTLHNSIFIAVETLPGYTSPENNVELSPDALPPVKYNGAVSQEYFRTPIPGASGVFMHQRRPIIPEDLPDSGSYGCQKGSESVSSEDSTLDGIQVTGDQQGRYNKLSRVLPQTPWILNGVRKAESSVEELISDQMKEIVKASDSRFGASGREDVDVRALGRGRPFYVELVDPHCIKIDFQGMRKLENEINENANGKIYVRDLQIVHKNSLEILKEGEEKKTKQYQALCLLLNHDAREICNSKLAELSEMFPITLQQSTPIRVLHRRPVAVREKTVHWLKTTQLEEHKDLFTISLNTQAGTYIKEFVHGDFGRTSPCLGELLGLEVDILALDVQEISLDWPPSVKYTS